MDRVGTNLPLQLNRFIGREHELREVKHLLGRTRLLTLTGSGGSGKTRLALQVAVDQLARFEDGVWLVELAPLSDPELISQTVASLFRVNALGDASPIESLTNFLRPKNLLLLLDNCEHLIQASAYFVEALLSNCPYLHVLATSREPLNIAGETSFRVTPLPFPDPEHLPSLDRVAQFESICLFVERARGAHPEFELTPANVRSIVQICCQLDGLPLAIELAAARVKTVGLDEIRARLENNFQLLAGGSRTAMPRQQTLRATMDWSHALLSDVERDLFRRLSVFAGSWTLEAAEVVCGDQDDGQVLQRLSCLIDKSLVNLQGQSTSVRYRFLELMRQYAHERLIQAGEAQKWQARHFEFYSSLVKQAEPQLLGAGQAEWLDRLEADHDNLRAALDWILDQGNVEAGLQFACYLGRFWYLRGYLLEGGEWFRRLLALANGHWPPLEAKALCLEAQLASSQSDIERASHLGEQSLALYRQIGDKQGIADALTILGVQAHRRGDRIRAVVLLEQSLDRYHEMGFKWGIAFAILILIDVWMRQGEIERASVPCEQALTGFRDLGDAWGNRFCSWQFGRDRQAPRTSRKSSRAVQRGVEIAPGPGASLGHSLRTRGARP